MNTTTPSAPSTLTLAKTGTVHGRPALVAYEGKQTILLVLPAEQGSNWSEIDRSPHSGIRGLGQMMKKLDKDSARNPSDQPAWIKDAQVEPAVAVEPVAAVAAVEAAPAFEHVTAHSALAEVLAELDATPATEPVVEVDASPLAGFLAADVIAEVATTTDLAFLRAAREEAARAGATPDALRVISMRAGEVVLGFDPAALKRKVAPKAEKAEKAPRAPRPEGATRGVSAAQQIANALAHPDTVRQPNGAVFVSASTLSACGFSPSACTQGSRWGHGTCGVAASRAGYSSSFSRKNGGVTLTPQ